jgi:MHS family citrate/tricarballylate:H+ symporter-like MFS transporter
LAHPAGRDAELSLHRSCRALSGGIGAAGSGFSAGAELGNVSVYLAEIARPGRKGFYVAWQSASQQVAVVLAAAIGYGLASMLNPAQMDAWGWRVPLVIGCLIVPVLLVLRRNLGESEEFEARVTRPTLPDHAGPVVHAGVAIAMGMVLMTVSFYTITAYTPTFGKLLHLPTEDNLTITALVGISNFIWLP